MTTTFDRVRALDDREQARQKLPIFYGSRDNYLHGFREVAINNTIDEITNNFDSGEIYITLHKDLETITVRDTGRGMPIAGESDGVPNWQLFFTQLFASGKYDIEDGVNSGTNGVGGTVLNYTSEIYIVRSWHNGEEYLIEFDNGGCVKTPLTFVGKTDKHGTEITFKLDKTCYTSTQYNQTDLKNIINKVSGVSPNTTIYFTYEDETTKYHYNDMEEYYEKNIAEHNYFKVNEKCYDEEYYSSFYEKNIREITHIEALFSTSIEPVQEAFLNRNHLIEGGTINKGFIDGMRIFINKYAKANAMYQKNEKAITSEDIENSVSFMVNVLSNNVEFQSQTKFSTKKELYERVAKTYIQEMLEIIAIEQKEKFIELVNAILLTKRANEKAENSRKDARKKLEQGMAKATARPSKYVPCRSKDKNEIEVIFIEGDSALNSIKSARNALKMAIYPLKGKVINAIKNSLDKVLANAEVQDIFQILGCGVTYKGKKVKGMPQFDINNLNVDKILICTDMDVDGLHIQSLLLGLFYVLAPELIKQGKVYILYTPLYIIKSKGKEYFAYSEEERNTIVRGFKGASFTETRYKGIGGLSPQVLNKTAMDEEKRKLKQITWDEVEAGIEVMEMCLSDETLAERKQFIETEGYKYFDFSLIED